MDFVAVSLPTEIIIPIPGSEFYLGAIAMYLFMGLIISVLFYHLEDEEDEPLGIIITFYIVFAIAWGLSLPLMVRDAVKGHKYSGEDEE